MSTPEFQIVSQVHDENHLTADKRNTESGWLITYNDLLTGQTGEVFCPDAYYTVDSVRTLIRDQLAVLRGVHGLSE